MHYSSALVAFVAAVSTVNAHGVILKATGDKGFSQGFLVDQTIARNCTTISPCQQDAVIIRDAEITENIVNECGRTEIDGNIDVGEQTENELAAGRIAQVKAGSTMKVTIHQVNADGAGPYECDLDQTSNAGPAGNVPLKVTNNVPGANGLSQAKEQQFTINVELPQDMKCIGASTGNMCTVRCRNNAIAGPFGGCFAVQQVGGGGRDNATAAGVTSKQDLQAVQAQILQNQKDLPVAIAANQAAGAAAGGDQTAGAAAISALLAVNPSTATNVRNPPAAATGAAAGNNNNNNNNNNKNGNNANAGNNKNGNNANAGNKNGNANAGNNAAGNKNGNAAAGNAAAGNKNGNAAAGNAAAGNKNGNANANAATGNGKNGKNNKRSAKFLA